ncbi:beta-ketoacyl-ACP reductase [Bacillus cereus]|nr:beta-ketoacyl-ACP reductase [Bacillus cereus]
MSFLNKVVLVTGGAKGIGKEIVKHFAMRGAYVLFTYNNSEVDAINFETELRSQGLRIRRLRLDVTHHDSATQTIGNVVEEAGTIDILVNNAGTTVDNLLMFMDENSWDKVIDTNLKGTFTCSKAVIPFMISQKSGVIINISSVAGHMGVSGQTNYCASKSGINGFTKALSKELASKNIRVNSVAPGYISTEMLNKVPDKIRRHFKEKIACGRIGTAEEVAKVVLFLATDDASYIHGQTITVDGGIS